MNYCRVRTSKLRGDSGTRLKRPLSFFSRNIYTRNVSQHHKLFAFNQRKHYSTNETISTHTITNTNLPMSYIHVVDSTHPPINKVGVIIHGLFGAGQNWRSIAQRLIKEKVFTELYLVDLKNHGSSQHTDKVSLVSMADDVKNFMKQLRLPCNTAILGHSLGGRVAMLTVLRELNGDSPKCWVQGYNGELVVIDISPTHYRSNIPVFIDFISAMEKLPLNSIKTRKDADAQLGHFITNNTVRSFLLTNLVQNDIGQWHWRVNLQGIKSGLFDIVGSDMKDVIDAKVPYEGNVFFINGEKSVYLTPDHHDIIKSYFPNYTHHTIPNAGHWVHFDQPNLFVSCLRDYFLHK